MEHVDVLLSAWESFYIIVGTAAATLIGLQFVIIVLSSELQMRRNADTVDAFASPTIVHLCAVLAVAATFSAPWPTLEAPRIGLSIGGAVGLGYAVLVVRRARRQTGYTLVLEDWLWHIILPLVAYGALLGAGLLLQSVPASALFVVSGSLLLLLCIGIHNAWDSVLYLSQHHRVITRDAQQQSTPPDSQQQ